MKKIINYEKEILFKTNIGEICSISLEHDFTVSEEELKGEFILSGEYRANELSVNKEPFLFHLPLVYTLEQNVDLSSLSYDIDNFEYTVKDDCLTVYIDFMVKYDERTIIPDIPNIPEITEEELNQEIGGLTKFSEMEELLETREEPIITTEKKEEEPIEELVLDDASVARLSEEDASVIIDASVMEDEYITYQVHIVKEGETIESIASEYHTTIENIKEYNSFETLEPKTKLIIPYQNE